ncbi:MFS transporter [Halieaceae bacterium IMCC14734]|uniref:MFS transporter n=1 Tax=Candidatus Litorirhabdus singularis TaxID=2518993 RepID=A0ABT3TGY1_9GAMM|nr:MFS transporter [Candidatus Litorirhabdus singularis]MCX2981578.1 MFS transporter [Candidatus Litorirhabdus singularis]
MNRILKSNITTIYLMGFCHSFMVVIPVFVPLLQGYGLTMSEVLQTQALFAMTIALLEVPSGYIADLWGRKQALIIGSLANAGGFLWLLGADSFFDFMLYEFILGVGISLISGADLALLYDSETELQALGDREAGPGRSLSRLISIEAGASGVAGIVASLLLVWADMAILLAVQAVVGLLPFCLAWRLQEARRPPSENGHADNARHIMELLLFGRPVVLWTVIAIVCFGLLGLYSFWVYQKYWELNGVPVVWFGYIWAAFALTVSVAARYAGVIEQRLGWRNLLLVTAILPLFGLLGMALSGGWYGVLFGFAIQASRGLSLTLFYEALNSRVPGEFRATVNSLVSLLVRSVFIVSGPLLGFLLDSWGMRSTLLLLVCVFAPLFLLLVVNLGRRIHREKSSPAAEPVVV